MARLCSNFEGRVKGLHNYWMQIGGEKKKISPKGRKQAALKRNFDICYNMDEPYAK